MAIIEQEIGEDYAIYNGDCVEVMRSFPDSKIHFSIYSPPFATFSGGLYHYSSSEKDLSNCKNYDEFFEHYFFVLKEIYRLTIPGRLTAVHCADVATGNTGCDAMIDFPGDLSRFHTMCRDPKCNASERTKAHGKCGHGWFERIAKYSIWKEPLGVRNRLMLKNLAHKTIVDDSSRCSNAAADYLLVFRRKGTNPIPISHPQGLMDYAGERKPPAELLKYRGWKGNQIENRYSHWIWRQYASSFWDDVRIDRVLPYREAKDEEDEKHVHPLQLDVIERGIYLWTNPEEIILTPFMGVGSEVYGALINGRKGIGIELKPSYFRQAMKNVRAAKEKNSIEQQSFNFTRSNNVENLLLD